jgi:hypothetical protein
MTEDRDLLPWILGGLSMAAVAMAIAVGLTGRTVPAQASSQTTASAPTVATARLNPMPDNTSPADVAPSSSAPSFAASSPAASSSAAPASTAPPQSAPASSPPGNQIWECTTDGVKTFSNNRCGNAAIRRDVGPINVMDASPAASNVHWYGTDNTNDASDYYYPAAAQPADNAYPVVVGIPYLERRRPEHPRQPNNHDRGHPHGN